MSSTVKLNQKKEVKFKRIFLNEAGATTLRDFRKRLIEKYPDVNGKKVNLKTLFEFSFQFLTKTHGKSYICRYVVNELNRTASNDARSSFAALEAYQLPKVLKFIFKTEIVDSLALVSDKVLANIMPELQYQQLQPRQRFVYQNSIVDLIFNLIIDTLLSMPDEQVEEFVSQYKKMPKLKTEKEIRLTLEKRIELREKENKAIDYILKKIQEKNSVNNVFMFKVAERLYSVYQHESTRMRKMRELISLMMKNGQIKRIGSAAFTTYCLPTASEKNIIREAGNKPLKLKVKQLLQNYLAMGNAWFSKEIGYEFIKKYLQITQESYLIAYHNACQLLLSEGNIVMVGSRKTGRYYAKDYADRELLINDEYVNEYLVKTMKYYNYLKDKFDDEKMLSLESIRNYYISLLKQDPLDKFLDDKEMLLRANVAIKLLRTKFNFAIIHYSPSGAPRKKYEFKSKNVK